MKKTTGFLLAGALALSIANISADPAQAASAADTYKGGTITILVGYGAGGTYGKTSLLLARHFSKNIPGNPTVIVQHMPGAGGLKSTNFAYNAMPKAGFNILMPPEMIVVSQLLRPTKVKYKTDKFTWLGRVLGSNTTVVVRRDSGIGSFQDLVTKKIVMAASGRGSPTFLIPSMLNNMMGAKMKTVIGYKGSRGTMLAMERGEGQGVALVWMAWSANKPEWFRGANSFAVPIVQSGFEKEKDLPNVPLIRDLMKTDEDRQIADLMATASLIGRGLAFPPGTPKYLIEPMRAALWKTVTDPAFIAEGTKRRLPVTPKTGAEIQKTVNRIMTTSPAIVKKAQKMVFGK